MVDRPESPPLRAALLSARPQDFAIWPTAQLPDVWAALFEMPVGNTDTATVVAVADGTASLYTTAGFGIIGAGHQPAIRRAADAFLRAVQRALADFSDPPASKSDTTVAKEVPFPSRDALAIVALTHDGARRCEVAAAEVDAPSVVGDALRAGNDLLTQIRLDDERRRVGPT